MKTKRKEFAPETEEFKIFDKFLPANKIKEQNHEKPYLDIITNWKNKRRRYSRIKSYYGSSL